MRVSGRLAAERLWGHVFSSRALLTRLSHPVRAWTRVKPVGSTSAIGLSRVRRNDHRGTPIDHHIDGNYSHCLLGLCHIAATAARYNAVGNFSRITEVATRIANQLPQEGNSAAFKEFAWRFVSCSATSSIQDWSTKFVPRQMETTPWAVPNFRHKLPSFWGDALHQGNQDGRGRE